MDSVVASEAIDPGSTPGARTKPRDKLPHLRAKPSHIFPRQTAASL